MLSQQEVAELLELARRNEEIQHRLDEVEEFLLGHHDLAGLLRHLCRKIIQVYQLELVTLVLDAEQPRLRQTLEGYPACDLPAAVSTQPRKELRLLLGDLERPFLSNRPTPELRQCFFPGATFLGSLAVMPLWVRGEFLGCLNLGSESLQRYQPGLETHFLERLGRKTAAGLDAALLLEQARGLERREAAVEMAGAACHELAQPLTTLTLQIEVLLRAMPASDPLSQKLRAVLANAERLGEQVQRIGQVKNYVTRPYAQGLRIIDMEAACDPPPGQTLRAEEELA
jgi:uncharacterized protein YigA (DUF484 family)